MHPDVAVILAIWVSAEYAFLVTRVMQKYHKGELVVNEGVLVSRKRKAEQDTALIPDEDDHLAHRAKLARIEEAQAAAIEAEAAAKKAEAAAIEAEAATKKADAAVAEAKARRLDVESRLLLTWMGGTTEAIPYMDPGLKMPVKKWFDLMWKWGWICTKLSYEVRCVSGLLVARTP